MVRAKNTDIDAKDDCLRKAFPYQACPGYEVQLSWYRGMESPRLLHRNVLRFLRQDDSGIENSAWSNISFPFHGTWCRVYFVSTHWFPPAHWTPSMARRRPQVSRGTLSMSHEKLHPLDLMRCSLTILAGIFCKMPCWLKVHAKGGHLGSAMMVINVFFMAQVGARKTRAVACEAPRRMRRVNHDAQ